VLSAGNAYQAVTPCFRYLAGLLIEAEFADDGSLSKKKWFYLADRGGGSSAK
jgi:hypothetical protein